MRSVADLMRLEGRVALITGGAGHIGRAMGAALAECGASIGVLDLDAAAAEAAAADLRATYGADAAAIVVDLGDESSVRSAPAAVLDRFGRLDVLVNNAALVGTSELAGWAVPFAEQNLDTWRRALEVNLTGPFLLTQLCAPALTASGRGSIINIGSIYGMSAPVMSLYDGTPFGNPAAYAASKAGLLQITRWLSTVLAPSVRSNAITIGGVWRQQTETFVERYTARTPMGRMATEEDLKGAVVYLAGDLSAYVTGQNLVVDGGWTAW